MDGLLPVYRVEEPMGGSDGKPDPELRHSDICPGCSADREQLRADLNSENEWVKSYPNPVYGGFLGKSSAQVNAELVIAKCSLCQEHFGWIKNSNTIIDEDDGYQD